ncbi:hypothetical protein NHX12_033782 [Muraenolepis orangiensis]|uniref:Uncharacterized protein n=1 Tax=Muraenolepis orangiensis TaxID=630683 RepID=A0A9Q0E4L4_9TELE|nr:hypothetical protein NHX12_033782 [Muraenolepis orangiensis]
MATGGRRRSTPPHLYYEGYLEKKTFRDKYVEKLDLTDFLSVMDDSSRDPKLDSAKFNLHLKRDRHFKLTAPSLEARELWKGYIQSIVKLSVPSSLNLLPGQIHNLKKAVEQERERRNMLDLKPGDLPASSVFKHYRVAPDGNPGQGFIIALQEPIPCATLHDVIAVMLEGTGGAFTPFVMEDTYEESLSKGLVVVEVVVVVVVKVSHCR